MAARAQRGEPNVSPRIRAGSSGSLHQSPREFDLNPAVPPIDWFAVLALVASVTVMIYLLQRSLRGMNQQDWILLRQARARGIDLKRAQSVNFVVFAATAETAAEIGQQMAGEGYCVSTRQAQIQFARSRAKPGAPQDGWLVTGNRTLTLEPQALNAARKLLTAMALERKALYLGWQLADLAPQLAADSPRAQSRAAEPGQPQ